MRQIGTLPKHLDPRTFADYLLSLGVKARIDDRPDGWHVWIYNEDHVPRAREELDGYLREPKDPRYRSAGQAAEAIRRDEKEKEKTFRKNYRDSSDVWGDPTFRKRPLTTIILVACVVIFILQNIPSFHWLTDRLEFSTYTIDEHARVQDFNLHDIRRGEVWRLVTPVLMHGSPIHLVFNLLMFRVFGTLIEIRRGTIRLAVLMLVSAGVSDYGQYIWMERMEDVVPFLGLSGVVYALFGYAWMKGAYQPEQGIGVNPGTVNFLLLWLVIGMSGVFPWIANGAHFVGLIVGIVFGLLGW